MNLNSHIEHFHFVKRLIGWCSIMFFNPTYFPSRCPVSKKKIFRESDGFQTFLDFCWRICRASSRGKTWKSVPSTTTSKIWPAPKEIEVWMESKIVEIQWTKSQVQIEESVLLSLECLKYQIKLTTTKVLLPKSIHYCLAFSANFQSKKWSWIEVL